MIRMAFAVSPRLIAFIFFTVLFHLVLSGLLTVAGALPVTVVLTLLLLFQRFEQLPLEKLRRFDSVFGLTSETNNVNHSAGKKDGLSRIILHRGGCVDAPENTMEAIHEAARQGVAGVEIDLQFTADGVGILLHDDTLDRTTDALGDVREKSFPELCKVNAAAKHKNGHKYSDHVKIPTLEECLTECLRHDLLVFIDCKAFAQKTANLVDELFSKYPELYERAAVCSFYPSIIYCMRKKNPQVITALTYRRMSLSCEVDCVTPRFTGLKHYLYTCLDYLNIWLTYAWSWQLCGNSFLLLNKESVCRNEVRWWNLLGIRVLPWTVNSEAEKGFCMDHLGLSVITDGLNTN